MNRNILLENIKKPAMFSPCPKCTKELLEKAMQAALIKVDRLLIDMGEENFPGEASRNNIYEPTRYDINWGDGFWVGILWLAYEATGDAKYRDQAEHLLERFFEKMDKKIGIDLHDLGFLYMPSCVAAYRITGNEKAKAYAIKAAEHLMTRYHENGEYIQAWGTVGEQLRLIVDCMNNIPLLYWASEVTGDSKFYDAAYKHAKTTMRYIVRDDASTFHTYFFHADGSPDRGTTCQGAADDSSWARGQAWLISGLPLSYRYTHDAEMIDLFHKITNYFLNRLPDDYVPYWDLIYTEGDEPRDSSSAAIAVCGMLEMLPHLKNDDPLKAVYQNATKHMVVSLYENYSTKDTPESNGLLLHGVYSKPGNAGVDESNIWGCYYYMEALMRMLKGHKAYW